jgi:hypothetical protein
MKKLTMAQLLLAANALIRVLELKAPNEQGENVPVVIDDDATEEKVTLIITEAVEYIEARDEVHFTLEEKAIIHEFAPDLYKKAAAELASQSEKDEPEPEDLENKEGDEPPAPTLLEEVQGALRLADLKDIATANAEFKSIRGGLSGYKTVVILKEAMVKILNEAVDPAQEAADKMHEKNIESKGVNEILTPEKEVITDPVKKEEKAVKPVKEKKEKAVKPEGSKSRAGIFAEIFNEGNPLSMSEWAEQMNLRYSSDSLAGAKTFTSLYMQILLELGVVTKKADGKYVKSVKK